MTTPTYLTISEAARAIGVSVDSIRNYERTGRLPALRTPGGMRLFALGDVERMARDRTERRAGLDVGRARQGARGARRI